MEAKCSCLRPGRGVGQFQGVDMSALQAARRAWDKFQGMRGGGQGPGWPRVSRVGGMRKLIYSMGVSLDGFIAGPRRRDRLVGARRGAAPVPQRADARGRRALLRAAAVRDDGHWETARRGSGAPRPSASSRASGRRCRRSCSRAPSSTSRATPGSSADGVAEEVAALRRSRARTSRSAAPAWPATPEARPHRRVPAVRQARWCSAAARRSSRPWTSRSSWSSSRPGHSARASSTSATSRQRGCLERSLRPTPPGWSGAGIGRCDEEAPRCSTGRGTRGRGSHGERNGGAAGSAARHFGNVTCGTGRSGPGRIDRSGSPGRAR